MYLLCTSTKCGIFELNMRKINFDLTNGEEEVEPYTKDEVLSFAGDRIAKIADNKAIIVNYIAFNWCKNGSGIDIVRNPLFKSIVQELATNGLTIADVNALAKKKVIVKGDGGEGCGDCVSVSVPHRRVGPDANVGLSKPTAKRTDVSKSDMEQMFQSFWESYPRQCPRKIDKKKCYAKFTSVMLKAKDAVSTFNQIMNGLEKWIQCDIWTKDGGQYIMAPIRWLNSENWNDEPMKGNGNGNTKKCNSANANYQSASSVGIF